MEHCLLILERNRLGGCGHAATDQVLQRQLLVAVLSWEHKMARYSSTDLGSVQSMVCIETGIVCVCVCVFKVSPIVTGLLV